LPKELNIKPRYDQKPFNLEDVKNNFKLLVSGQKNSDTLWINQDAYLYIGKFTENTEYEYKLNNTKNGVFMLAINGSLMVDGQILEEKDSIEVEDVESIRFKTRTDTKILLIEVPF